jgi:hypothetical protein
MTFTTVIVLVSIAFGEKPVVVKEYASGAGVYSSCKQEARTLTKNTSVRHDCTIQRG